MKLNPKKKKKGMKGIGLRNGGYLGRSEMEPKEVRENERTRKGYQTKDMKWRFL